MFDVYSFLYSMKISWLRRISVDSYIRDFVLNLYPELDMLNKLGGDYANVLMQRIHNPFWRDVLKHYKKLNFKCMPEGVHKFMSECLHYNVNITRDKRVVYVKEWVDAGLLTLRQLVNLDGKYLTFAQFKQQFPMITRTNFLVYEGIINSIKQFQRKRKIEGLGNIRLLVYIKV